MAINFTGLYRGAGDVAKCVGTVGGGIALTQGSAITTAVAGAAIAAAPVVGAAVAGGVVGGAIGLGIAKVIDVLSDDK